MDTDSFNDLERGKAADVSDACGMIPLTEFDRYPKIRYKDTTKPFWGVYTYRVSIAYPEEYKLGRKKRSFFAKSLKEENIAPKVMTGDWVVNLFFQDDKAAFAAIERYHDRVTEVVRPRSEHEKRTMLEDQNIMVRENLFWGEYRWRIIFKLDFSGEIDDWIASTFSKSNKRRVFCSISVPRRLYLNKESDVLLSKLALDSHIDRIEKVILKEEIKHAYESDQASR